MFTIERHKELGTKLKEVSSFLTNLHVEVAKEYGKSERKAKLLDAILLRLGDLRSELDDCILGENESASETEKEKYIHFYY